MQTMKTRREVRKYHCWCHKP